MRETYLAEETLAGMARRCEEAAIAAAAQLPDPCQASVRDGPHTLSESTLIGQTLGN